MTHSVFLAIITASLQITYLPTGRDEDWMALMYKTIAARLDPSLLS